MQSKEMYETIWRTYKADGELDYILYVFGDFIADREGYKKHNGIDATRFYLMNKYGWLPSQVKAMSMEDLHFCLAEEMYGFKLPNECIF